MSKRLIHLRNLDIFRYVKGKGKQGTRTPVTNAIWRGATYVFQSINSLYAPLKNTGKTYLTGIASPADVAYSLNSPEIKMRNFNVLNTLVGWNPVSWTDFFFTGTIFDDLGMVNTKPKPASNLTTPTYPEYPHFIGTIE